MMDETINKSIDALTDLLSNMLANVYLKLVNQGVPKEYAKDIAAALSPACVGMLLAAPAYKDKTSDYADALSKLDDSLFYKA